MQLLAKGRDRLEDFLTFRHRLNCSTVCPKIITYFIRLLDLIIYTYIDYRYQ